MSDEELWNIERKLWLDGPDFYDNAMDENCVMVFQQMGIMRAFDVLESLKQAPRWQDVDITSKTVSRAGDQIIIAGYRAIAQRSGTELYSCLCTSTYRKNQGRWILIQHQQTPISMQQSEEIV